MSETHIDPTNEVVFAVVGWLLGGCLLFAVSYWLFFESFAVGNGSMEQYNADQLAALETGEPVTEEELAAMVNANHRSRPENGSLPRTACAATVNKARARSAPT